MSYSNHHSVRNHTLGGNINQLGSTNSLPLPPSHLPNNGDQFSQNVVLALSNSVRAKNTSAAYEPKMREFYEYCDYKFKDECFRTSRYVLTPDKAYDFMFFQALREKRKRGGKKRNANSLLFDCQQYEEVKDKYNNTITPIHPKEPLTCESFDQYRSALWTIHQEQSAANCNSLAWEFIWNHHLKTLRKYVKTRKPIQKKINYLEKVDYEFAPFTACADFERIEEELWSRGQNHGYQSALAWLRNRYCFLQTFSGILRCESVMKAELSDMLEIEIQKHDDVHPINLLVMQIATGKTNNGKRIYGRAMRHRDVRRCCFGALSMYLVYRFAVSEEMNPPPDFTNNESWFDIKLLTNGTKENNTVSMSDNVYPKAMRKVLDHLGVASNHWAHLGRVLGAAFLELLEAESSEIQALGNWNLSMQQQRYSTHIPMGIIRKMAGFVEDNGIHFNPRTILTPSDSLKQQLMPWVDQSHAAVRAKQKEGFDLYTADHFLRLMDRLRVIFFQDVAAMLHLHPERKDHPLFLLPIFSSLEFTEYSQKMAQVLESTQNPIARGLENVLPGVNQRLNAIVSTLESTKRSHDNRFDSIEELYKSTSQESTIKLAKEYLNLAHNLLRGVTSPSMNSQCSWPAVGQIAHKPEVSENTNTGTQSTNKSINENISNEDLDFSTVILNSPVHSIRVLYEEFFGQNNFKGYPIDGGIDAMEKRYGSAWRKHFKAKDRVHLCRMKRVCHFISQSKDVENTITELNELFLKRNKSLLWITTFVIDLEKITTATLNQEDVSTLTN